MVEVTSDHPRAAWPVRVARARAEGFLRRLGERRPLTVLLTGDARVRKLNRTFRGIDRTTDVLSFPSESKGYLGDLAISLDVARRAAREHGVALSEELARYLAHGILHLLGHDHEGSRREAARMAALEARLLGGPGMIARAGEAPGPLLRLDRRGNRGRKRG